MTCSIEQPRRRRRDPTLAIGWAIALVPYVAAVVARLCHLI